MKKLGLLLGLLLAVTMGSHRVFAQSVTITLIPGWNWISVPLMDTLDFETALGSFTPVPGDIIKSQWGNAIFRADGQWRGQISHFYPGYGYKYYSNRMMPVMVTFQAQQPAPQIIVTTMEPTDITVNSATCGGNVASNDGNYVSVTLRGICWSTNPNPTFNDNYIEVGDGFGSFTVSLTELTIGTTYYVRAFAVTANGTFYGDQNAFSTRDGIPTLTTADVTSIYVSSAGCGGNITDDGGLTITARGVCWSTSSNPTSTDSHTIDGYGMGSFNCRITGLNANTTYYVRAYATNEYATAYGNEVSFTTMETSAGIIDGLFSVSATQQVYFSQGNLQYQASTDTWRFAENQWNYVGEANANISPSYDGWIDLFGCGNNPTNSSTNDYDYYGAPFDWGCHAISNGGNIENKWRTLTVDELAYILVARNTNSGIRYAKGVVNNINGFILLPDNWSDTIFEVNDPNNQSASYDSNIITQTTWTTLENSGAVFLPAAGYRLGTTIYNTGNQGAYWTYTSGDWNSIYFLTFDVYGMNYLGGTSRCTGNSVRLVQDYQP